MYAVSTDTWRFVIMRMVSTGTIGVPDVGPRLHAFIA